MEEHGYLRQTPSIPSSSSTMSASDNKKQLEEKNQMAADTSTKATTSSSAVTTNATPQQDNKNDNNNNNDAKIVESAAKEVIENKANSPTPPSQSQAQNQENKLVDTTPKIATSDAQGNNNNNANPERVKLQRFMNEVKDGGIHACARISTRYEAKYLIPWIYYHKRLGISVFHFYYDSYSSNMTIPEEKKAYDMIAGMPFVNIIDIQKVGHTREGHSLNHCLQEAHKEKKAKWIMDFDIDEVVAFGDTITSQPNCADNRGKHVPENALVKYVETIPESTIAVIMPRITFGQNNVTALPVNQPAHQLELFTRRQDKFSQPPKILVRTNVPGFKMYSKHDLHFNQTGAVMYPSGKIVSPMADSCQEKDNYCKYTHDYKEYPFDDISQKVPRMFHYQPRSLKECTGKTDDFRDKDGYRDNWRVKNKNVCRSDWYNDIPDFTLFCASKDVTHDLKILYPHLDKAPYVF